MLPPIHVIDFEGSRAHGIMEFGLVTLESNKIKHIFYRKCSPKFSPQNAPFREHSRFHGDATQHSFAEYLPLFRAKRQSGFFCAHNATVEDRLLRQYTFLPPIVKNMAFHALPDAYRPSDKTPVLTQITPPAIAPSWGPWIDTYRIYRKFYTAAKNYTLAELIRHFRLETELKALVAQHANNKKLTFHRALDDALATTLLLQNFIALFHLKDIRFLLEC
jgi:DNA polymerase III epsilon subunit-like protein